MKKILLIVILSLWLTTQSQADDIKDFEIEGISIGDSLLDHTNKSYINDNSAKWYNDEYHQLILKVDYQTYQDVIVSYKSKDKKYIIESISGAIHYEKNIEKCYKKQNELDKVFSAMFGVKNRRVDILPDNGTNNTSKQIVFELKDGSVIIDCLDWDQIVEPNFRDKILVSLDSSKFREWLYKNSK